MSTKLENKPKLSNDIYTVLPVAAPKIELYNMDCMDYMRTCRDNEFDLAIVDPPYGININNNMGRRKGDKKSTYKKITWDNEIPTAEYFNELKRVSKNQVIWGGNYFLEHLNSTPCFLLWDKMFSEDLSFAQFEMAWTSFNTSSKKIEIHPSNIKNRKHPTQKPKKLYEWILKKYANKGDKILDTHLGSGSSAIASYNYKFDFVGLEIDKEYFDNAVERFNDYKAQLTLF